MHDCDAHAICTNTQGDHSCVCEKGYSGDGKTCNDINECSLNLDNCHAMADCINTDGGFTCACRLGYEGTGRNQVGTGKNRSKWSLGLVSQKGCRDINECSKGIHNCDSNSQCVNNAGSYTCECDDGYTGNGLNCQEVNECSIGTHNCDDSASCTNTAGGFTCLI